jgi:hypothetical protein
VIDVESRKPRKTAKVDYFRGYFLMNSIILIKTVSVINFV